MMNGFGTHGWGMGFGWLIGFVILIIIIWLVIKVVNQNSHTGSGHEKSALDILKERYARGEIDKDEFDQRKKDLV